MPVASPPAREKDPATTLREALAAARVGVPLSHRGLSVIPLIRQQPLPAGPDYSILRDALAAGVVRITEVSAAGSVPQLAVVNTGDRPVLLVDGEELIGAKQNRIVNLTVLVPARHTLPIPVSCVEQGRWNLDSPGFATSKQVMLGRARAQKARDVTRSLREGGRRHADQGAVWSGIAEAAQSLSVHSPTGAMSDMYQAHDLTLEDYERVLEPTRDQVGAIFAIEGEIVALDLFDDPSTLAAYLPKLVRAHALELFVRRGGAARPITDSPADDRNTDELVGRCTHFLAAITDMPATTHRAIGLGVDIRMDTDALSVAALEHGGRVMHLAAFDNRHATRSEPRPPGDYAGWPVRPRPRGRDPLRIMDNRAIAAELIESGQLGVSNSYVLHRELMPLPRGEVTWNRVEGMLLGLAIGDALGNTSEALNPGARRERHGEIRDYLPNRHAEGRRVGLPSDDTQLAFWTLEHLLEHDGLHPEHLAERFAREEIFGIGGTVKDFLRRYKAHDRPWHALGVASAGNGALMRIAPVLVPHLVDQSPALWSDVVLAASLTHNDRASTSACVAFTAMLWELLGTATAPRPEWWIDTWVRIAERLEGSSVYRSRVPGDDYAGSVANFVNTRVRVALREGRSVRRACDSWYSGAYLLETVPSALYILARHAHDPEEAIVRAVNDTRDNDTVAAIVGAAVGALHGREALPRRWVDGLLGRMGARDDGRVFELIAAARARFG